MNIADRRLASETQLPRGNNFAEVNPSIIVDHQPFIRRAGGADPTFRAECETALRAYFRRLALIERLPNLIDHRATYSALVDDGVDVLTTQEREAAWEQFSDDATKEAAKGKLLGAILARLAADTETGAREVFRAPD
jgi:hypothetical protein